MAFGLGHLYAGQPRKALLRYLTGMAGMTAVYLSILWLQAAFAAAFVALTVMLAIAFDAARTARRAPADYQRKRYNRWYVYMGLIILNGFLLDIPQSVVRGKIQAFRIPSGAMEPTLLIGDYLYVSKTRPAREDIHLGSIVVHRSAEDPRVYMVKRVVGLPGDTIAMVGNGLVRNGRVVVEPYVQVGGEAEDRTDSLMSWQLEHLAGGNRRDYRPTAQTWGPLLVPPDSLFVLGDNRDNSYDSRYTGFVARSQVVGQPIQIYYSYDRNGLLPLPFLTAIRWERIRRRL